MADSDLAAERIARAGEIRRCRGYRLYARDGRRLLDLWQAGGRAILGHRQSGVSARIREDLDRGLADPVASGRERALGAMLTSMVPGCVRATVRFYRNRERALAAIAAILEVGVDRIRAHEPFGPIPDHQPVLWRPFLPPELWKEVLGANPAAILPVVPVPAVLQLQPVVFTGNVAPNGDVIPPMEISAAASAVDAVSRADIPATLNLSGFASYGPYLLRANDREDYDAVFDAFLDRDILLSPDSRVPSIVPGVMSDGESSHLVVAARETGSKATRHDH